MKQIPSKITSRLLDSMGFMNWHYGVTFNTIITINFEQLGLKSNKEISQAKTKLNCALQRQVIFAGEKAGLNSQHHFIYAMERSRDHGLHMHLLMVSPGMLAGTLPLWLLKWAKRNYGNDINPNAVNARSALDRNNDRRIATQNRMVKYILKTTDDSIATDRDGNPVVLKQLLDLKRGRTSLNIDTNRIGGSSQTISLKEQIGHGYIPHEFWEDVFSDKMLMEHSLHKRNEELDRILRHISK